jgi:hypothetical protein
VHKTPLYLRYPKTPQHPPCVPAKITPSDGIISDVYWLSQKLLGGSSIENLLTKVKIGVIFSKISEWPCFVLRNKCLCKQSGQINVPPEKYGL